MPLLSLVSVLSLVHPTATTHDGEDAAKQAMATLLTLQQHICGSKRDGRHARHRQRGVRKLDDRQDEADLRHQVGLLQPHHQLGLARLLLEVQRRKGRRQLLLLTAACRS